ncbi:hypothetical protein FB451DRAFT_1220164 [Mycena latifolia]|nr:hypothetical protein FB451DRAFT_1220164 [Mycena latifolia]
MDSPVHEKFGTNYSPLDSEVSQIKQLLIQPCAEIERIDGEIARLQDRRRELSIYVDGHRALISPIRHLPVDVIGEIFMACFPTGQNAIMSAQEAPLLLGRICSAWRTIAISTPRIWSSIHIAEPDGRLPEYIYEGCLQLVKTWLGRSGGLPLSISFFRPPPSGPSRFFDTIVSVSQRWKHVVLLGQVGIRLSRTDVPMLHSIQILDYAVGDDLAAAEAHDFFRGARVRKVVLGTDINPGGLPLPWHQLTTLSLCPCLDPSGIHRRSALNLSSSTALNILAECHSLRECTLQLSSGVDETIEVPSSVELPLLVSLNILIGGNAALQRDDPLDRLTLPELSRFSFIGFPSQSTGFPFPSLISTAAKLKHVAVGAPLFTRDLFVAFLHQLPSSLHSLSMQQNILGTGAPAFVDDEMLGLLTPSPDTPSQPAHTPAPRPFLFPELDTIRFIYAAHFSDEALFRFIHARMHTEHRLRRIKVTFFRSMESDILPRVQPFIDKFGLECLLSYNINRTQSWDPRAGMPPMSLPLMLS